jgi:hypothetical protein
MLRHACGFVWRRRSDLDSAFAAVAQEHIDAVHIGVDGLFGTNRARLVSLAARYRVPTSYPWREFTLEGGLMNYGAIIREQFHEVGSYTARILRGEKPADMPVQRPTKLGCGNGALPHGPSYRARPRLYHCGGSRQCSRMSAMEAKQTLGSRGRHRRT